MQNAGDGEYPPQRDMLTQQHAVKQRAEQRTGGKRHAAVAKGQGIKIESGEQKGGQAVVAEQADVKCRHQYCRQRNIFIPRHPPQHAKKRLPCAILRTRFRHQPQAAQQERGGQKRQRAEDAAHPPDGGQSAADIDPDGRTHRQRQADKRKNPRQLPPAIAVPQDRLRHYGAGCRANCRHYTRRQQQRKIRGPQRHQTSHRINAQPGQQSRTPTVAIAESAPQQYADGKTDKVDGEGLRRLRRAHGKLGADIGQRRAINRFRYLRKHQ